MGKSKAHASSSSRALKRLEAFNKSPGSVVERVNSGEDEQTRGSVSNSQTRDVPRTVQRQSSDREESEESRRDVCSISRSRVRERQNRGSSSRSSRNRSRSSDRNRRERSHRSRRSRDRSVSRHDEPPAWARDLLKQQKQNASDLRRLKADLEAKSSARAQSDPVKAKPAEHDFRFEGNKRQYQVNQSVVEHIDRALSYNDNDDVTQELTEGKKLLAERNKHILLAEKYGWDTVNCYTAEPLASDSEDEKKIRKAIKESKALRNEKKVSTSRAKARKPMFSYPRQGPSSGNVAARPTKLDNLSAKQVRDDIVRCFRCGRPGHIARECRAANSRFVITSASSSGQNTTQ